MGTLQDFDTVMDLVFSGALKAVVDRTFPLEEVAAAQARLDAGEQLGKITLSID
jgi:NADPH:quinone reductase-like Zn-dependent oxidoreductase